MDQKDIYDIMDKVNETNEYNNDNLLSDLPRRTPLVSKNRSVVYRSVDPVQSVSSTEPLSESGTKVSTLKNIMQNNTDSKKITKHVSIQEPVNDSPSSSTDESSSVTVPGVTYQQSNMTSFLGYNIPWSTLYFLLVIIVISVALYFLTGEKKKEKEKEKEKIKDKDTDREREKDKRSNEDE